MGARWRRHNILMTSVQKWHLTRELSPFSSDASAVLSWDPGSGSLTSLGLTGALEHEKLAHDYLHYLATGAVSMMAATGPRVRDAFAGKQRGPTATRNNRPSERGQSNSGVACLDAVAPDAFLNKWSWGLWPDVTNGRSGLAETGWIDKLGRGRCEPRPIIVDPARPVGRGLCKPSPNLVRHEANFLVFSMY